MGCFPRSTCLGSLSLTQSLNLLVFGEGLEIRDNHLCAIREHLGDSKWSRPMGLKLAQENLQSRVKEEDSIIDVENSVFDLRVMEPLSFLFIDQRSDGQSLHASRPSMLCAQARSVDDMPFRTRDDMPFRTRAYTNQTVSDTILKHDLCELVITEVHIGITNDGMGSSKPRKERFQEFANNSGVVGGEFFCFNPFRQ
nr:hypothetical protein [Tanacetum cinerariifolium]